MAKFVNVRVDQEALDKARSDLEGIKNGFVRAYARALNKSATGAQTDMVAMARDDYTYKIASVKARMQLYRATWSNLKASVRSKGGLVPLTDFANTRQTSTGLTVNIKRSTGLQRIRHAFIAPGKYSGKKLAFWRAKTDSDVHPVTAAGRQLAQAVAAGEVTAAGRVWQYPILSLTGPHPEVVWHAKENWEKLQNKTSDRLPAAFSHEVDYVLQQFGGA